MKKTTMIIMSIFTMILLGSVYTWSVFRIPVEDYYQVNTFLSGLPYMVSLFFYAFAMAVTGRYLTPKTVKKITYIGIFFIFFGWLMAGFTREIYSLILMYGVFIGIGVGMLYGIPIMIIQSRFKKNNGFYTGLALAGFGLSPLVTAPLIDLLLKMGTLHQTFILMGFTTLIILLMTTSKLIAVNHYEESAPKKISKINIDKKFIILYILFMLGTTIGLMMIGLSYQIGVQYYMFTSSHVTIAMTVFALANGLSRLLFGYLSDRYMVKSIIKIALLILLISGMIAYFNQGSSYGLYLLSFSGFWFILGAWLAIAPNAIKTLYGLENYSRRYGVLFTAYGIGAIIGVSSSGLLLDALHETKVLYIAIIGVSLFSYILLNLTRKVSNF